MLDMNMITYTCVYNADLYILYAIYDYLHYICLYFMYIYI